MDENNNTSPEPEVVSFTREESQYLLSLIAKYKDPILKITTEVPPDDLLPVLAYLVVILETQIPAATEALDEELRPFYRAVYPKILAGLEEQMGKPLADGLIVVIPELEVVASPFKESVDQPVQSVLIS